MAAGWSCKECGTVNNRERSECERCGAKRAIGAIPKIPLVIGISGVVFLAIVIFAIYSLVTLPKKKYLAAFTLAYQDMNITSEEQEELDRIAKLYRLSEDTRKAWQREVIPTPPQGKGPIRADHPPTPDMTSQSIQRPSRTRTDPSPPAQLAPTSPSLEAKQNLQQGMTYVSLAKQNPGKAYENYDNAILEFTRAIEKYPCYATAYGNRAVAYMQQKKFNNALKDLNKAAECDSEDPIIYYNLTALHSLEDDHDLALGALEKALALGFNNYDALRSDPDLNNIRRDRDFRRVLDKHKIFLK